MTTPDRITLDPADLAELPGHELFAALAYAGLTRAGMSEAFHAVDDPNGDPVLALKGIRLLQALALVMALRNHPDPAPTWEEAQGWDVRSAPALEDPVALDRRDYRVHAAIATGLPPDEAERLPVAEVEAIAAARRRAG